MEPTKCNFCERPSDDPSGIKFTVNSENDTLICDWCVNTIVLNRMGLAMTKEEQVIKHGTD